jgi:uncharacterized damage-inducible protein DinB
MRAIDTLTRYKAWADAVFFDCVSGLQEAQLVAAQPIVFGSLIRTLHHSYLMDYAWKCNLLGEPHGLTTRNPVEHPDFRTLRERQATLDAWFVAYASALPDSELDAGIEFEFIGGGQGRMSRADVLLHVVNHTTYHRGHAADMLYHFGVMPPATDLPVFLRESSR